MLRNKIVKVRKYLERNGVKKTFYALIERGIEKRDYHFVPVTPEEADRQSRKVWASNVTFSIIVPAYRTPQEYLTACIESVLSQTYPHFELIIADASPDDSVRNIASRYTDYRVKYMKLESNDGISANTNAGIRVAIGEYIGLLDHDDVLTRDCLYEYATLIEKGKKEDTNYAFIYSDEDKCDESGQNFFDPNIKPDFNPDLLMSNNYICHFLVMRGRLMKELKLREEYDGAQDHDLVLRAYSVTREMSAVKRVEYGHIPKVLYHWRTHRASTAANPESKLYAYESGRRAIEDHLKRTGITGKVIPTDHVGFFRIEYIDSLDYSDDKVKLRKKRILTSTKRGRIAYNTFLNRYDVGAIGGALIKKGRYVGGPMDSTRTCPFDGMNRHFSGYMHRAVLQSDYQALDIRNMLLHDDLAYLFIKYAKDERYMHLFDRQGVLDLEQAVKEGEYDSPYVDVSDYLIFRDGEDYDYLDMSIALGREVNMDGYYNLYEPALNEEL